MNAATHTDPPVVTTAPIALWRIAEAFMHILFSLFGSPSDVARSDTLLTAPHQLMCAWLRVAEALLRRLLLIEASALPACKPAAPHAKRQHIRRLVEFFPDKPEDWRVRFRCFQSDSASAAFDGLRQAPSDNGAQFHSSASLSSSKGARLAKRFHSAWPLALRFEAVLRVFNNPLPFARRLARRLRAHLHRLKDVLRAPADAVHKIGDEAWASLTGAAIKCWPAANTS